MAVDTAETVTDTEAIMEAEALIMRGLDTLRVVALRCHTRDRKSEIMRQLRQQARSKEMAPECDEHPAA